MHMSEVSVKLSKVVSSVVMSCGNVIVEESTEGIEESTAVYMKMAEGSKD